MRRRDPPERPLKPSTVASYKKRTKNLHLACAEELGLVGVPADTVMVNWMIGRKAALAPSTWQQYKAAVIHTLGDVETALSFERGHPFSHADRARRLSDCSAALELLRLETQAGCAKQTANTSARKAKRLPEPDRMKIEAALAGKRSRYGGALRDLLRASVRTGLRPVEWATVKILQHSESGVLILQVQNAKADNERAHGPTRTLRLQRLPAEDRDALIRWVAYIQAGGVDAQKLMKALGDLLYSITRKIWPTRATHYTLYSARHEFAAVAKLRFSALEVGALMGHATDVTATDHYGRYRPSGKFPPELRRIIDLLPTPDPGEVGRVRPKLAERLSRIPARHSPRAPGM